MKAMILAAGRGSRMRELTEHRPKPLLEVAGRALIEHHLARLESAGAHQIVINTSYLGEQIISALGDGSRYGVEILWSREEIALETGAGIRRALLKLGEAPFWLVNADIWCDIDFNALGRHLNGDLARLVMVDPPAHNLQGDFHLDNRGRLHATGDNRLVYAGAALVDPDLVKALSPDQPMPLKPSLLKAIEEGRLGGYHHRGTWSDIGTPERLEAIRAELSKERFSG